MLETGCYCGDAPNDQVMFSRFPVSFGVGNIKKRELNRCSFCLHLSQKMKVEKGLLR